MVLIIGHRGAPSLAPENTPESISKAIDVGVDAVGIDVWLTRDGVAVAGQRPQPEARNGSRQRLRS